ncbi:hypothetical protein ZEAMMB73_Zm00001d003741 [Zea mays]|uniref:Uncharacterized protein n=1 Tax=Zea mays TaxID=4577 RepID=A0A1D6EBC9_MAIZE|nr:hypothetical protein ZEAMMB73_Zm00001d003741 [Zea mays]
MRATASFPAHVALLRLLPVAVGSSVEVVEVLLKTQDLAYLDRPRMACGKHTVYNYSGMLWSHYGPYRRQLRELWVTELLSARQLRLTERVRVEEVRAMLRDLHPATSTSTTAVVLKERLLMVTLNVISRMVLGKKYVGEDGARPSAATTSEEFRWMIEEIFFLNGALHVGDMVTWLGWLDAHGYVGRMKRLAAKFDRLIEHVLREHGERRRREGDAFVPGDMVDLLLYLCLIITYFAVTIVLTPPVVRALRKKTKPLPVHSLGPENIRWTNLSTGRKGNIVAIASTQKSGLHKKVYIMADVLRT